MAVRGGHVTDLRVTGASGMIGAVNPRSRACIMKTLLLSGSVAYAMLAGLCIPGDAGAEMPAAGAGVTPGSSGIPPAGAGLIRGTPGVPPAGAGATPGSVGGVVHRPQVPQFFLANPPLVWAPGFWAWDGFEWVWVPGYWCVWGQGLSNPCE